MKASTREDYVRLVYKVVFYIEQNADKELSLEELAKVAGFSKYHFHRIFKAVTGENIGDFIARVRLVYSAWKLKTEPKITDVALSCGFETNASFSKAFKNRFGVSPRTYATQLKAKKGVVMLKPTMVEFKPLSVFYVRKTGAYETSSCEAWNVLMAFAYEQRMKFRKNIMGKATMHFGIGHDNPSLVEQNLLRYDACITCEDESIEVKGEVFKKVLDGGKCAVFLHKGAYENLKATYAQIMDWVVSEGVALRDAPLFEKYLNRDPRRTKPENLRTEIYVPIA